MPPSKTHIGSDTSARRRNETMETLPTLATPGGPAAAEAGATASAVTSGQKKRKAISDGDESAVEAATKNLLSGKKSKKKKPTPTPDADEDAPKVRV